MDRIPDIKYNSHRINMSVDDANTNIEGDCWCRDGWIVYM